MQASNDSEQSEDQSESHLAPGAISGSHSSHGVEHSMKSQQMWEEELQASNDDEQAEDQPEPHLAPVTTSGSHPLHCELPPTTSRSEGEGSYNIPVQCLPNVELEHHPDCPMFSEDTRPRPTKRLHVNHTQSAILAPNQDVYSNSRGPGKTQQPPVIHPSSQAQHLDVPQTTNQQLPTIPHSTRCPS